MLNKQVSIAVPCMQVVEPKTLQSMMALVNFSARNGIDVVDIGITEREMIDDARNHLTETFLSTDTEWLFWMDSDMTFPKDTLVNLFEVVEKHDAKIATGVYYQRKGKNFPVLWSRNDELESGGRTGVMNTTGRNNKYAGSFIFPHKDKKEAFKVHSAGFGCVLVHRSVFEVMPRPWFKFIKGTCSEDFYFLVNAQDLGFDVWADPRPDLGHIGDAPVITKADFWKNGTKVNLEIETLK